MGRHRWLAGLFVGVAVLSACEPDPDEVIGVDTTADTVDADPGDGLCADASGACSLRAAIMEANTSTDIDRILLPADTYLLTIAGADDDTGATGDLDVRSSIYIDSTGGTATLDGAALGDRILDVHAGRWHRFDGLRLINGNVTGEGGGLRTRSGTTGGRLDVTGNQATVAGGGIANTAVLSLHGSSVSANTAPVGGGISNTGYLQLDNSTLSANVGGALAADGLARLRFSTVTDNAGGGIAGQAGAVEVRGAVIAHQADGTDCATPASSFGHNVDSDDTCGLDQPGDVASATIPFGPLQSADPSSFPGHEPSASSVLDNGVPAGVHGCGDAITDDQFGRVRPVGSGCDIGAIETRRLSLTSFCSFDGIVQELVDSPGGTIVGGEFSRATDPTGTDVARPGLARCLDDGRVDTTFDPGLGASVHTLATHGPWLYIGGEFDVTIGATQLQGLARLDLATGSVDPTWHPEANGSVRALAVDDDGVFVGGNLTHIDSTPVSRLAKLDATTGALMSGFSVTMSHSIGWENVLSLHLHSSGDLFVGGTFETINGASRSSVARLDAADGDVRPFSPDLTDTNPNDPKVQIEAIVGHAGSIYLCGDWWETEGVGSQTDQRNIGRFDPSTGAADMNWLPSISRGLQSCAVDDAAANLVVGGDHTVVDGATVGAVQGIGLSTATVDQSWLPDPTTSVGVKALLVTDDGVVLGGDITAASGTPVGNAARYAAD